VNSKYLLSDRYIHCATILTFGGEGHTRVPYYWPASVTTYMAIAKASARSVDLELPR
jgi:hypothetical protein